MGWGWSGGPDVGADVAASEACATRPWTRSRPRCDGVRDAGRGRHDRLVAAKPNPALGYRVRAGAIRLGRRAPGSTPGRSDRGYPDTPPAGTLRVAVVGDSVTHAQDVVAERTFPKLLERSLSAGGDVEVINAGISGYN